MSDGSFLSFILVCPPRYGTFPFSLPIASPLPLLLSYPLTFQNTNSVPEYLQSMTCQEPQDDISSQKKIHRNYTSPHIKPKFPKNPWPSCHHAQLGRRDIDIHQVSPIHQVPQVSQITHQLQEHPANTGYDGVHVNIGDSPAYTRRPQFDDRHIPREDQ